MWMTGAAIFGQAAAILKISLATPTLSLNRIDTLMGTKQWLFLFFVTR